MSAVCPDLYARWKARTSPPSGWVCVTSGYPLGMLCGSQGWVGASVPSCRGLAQWKVRTKRATENRNSDRGPGRGEGHSDDVRFVLLSCRGLSGHEA